MGAEIDPDAAEIFSTFLVIKITLNVYVWSDFIDLTVERLPNVRVPSELLNQIDSTRVVLDEPLRGKTGTDRISFRIPE